MTFINREQAQAILDTRPPGTSIPDALKALSEQGLTIEGYNDKSVADKVGEGALNVGKTVLGAIAEPSARLGQTAGSAAIAGYNTLANGGSFGDNYQKATEVYKKSGDVLGNAVFGESVQPDTNLKQVVSDIGQTAANFLPYNKIAGGVVGATGSKLLGQVGAGVTGGYLVDVSNNLRNNSEQPLGASDFKPGMGTAVGAAIPIALAGAEVAGRGLQKLGEKVAGVVTPVDTQEARLVQTYQANNSFMDRIKNVIMDTGDSPRTTNKTLVDKGLFGTKSGIGTRAEKAQKTLWNKLIQPSLDNAGVEVNLPKYFDTVEEQIINSTDDLTRQNALKEALNSIREDYAGKQNISLADLQKLKEGWAEFVPEKFYKGQNIAGNVRQVQALLADEARQTIYNTLGPDIRQAYLDYGNLKGLKELGIVAKTGQKLKGGSGSFITDIASRLVTPIGTFGGQVIYRIGQRLEFVGEKGAKTLGDVLGI